jgi:hypothetical protein
MTSAINTSARTVRLSITSGAVAREPGHIHPGGTDDSAQFGAPPASYREARRASRALRWRRQSSLDNNGTRAATAGRERPGTLERKGRAPYAYSLYRRFIDNDSHVGAQRIERGGVRLAPSPDDDVPRRSPLQRWQQLQTSELLEAPLEPVPIDGRMLVARNDYANA